MTSTRETLREAVARAIHNDRLHGMVAWIDVSAAHKTRYRGYADAALAAIEAAGWRVVPVEATIEMLRTGASRSRDFYSETDVYPRTKAIYRAMLSAAPRIAEKE